MNEGGREREKTRAQHVYSINMLGSKQHREVVVHSRGAIEEATNNPLELHLSCLCTLSPFHGLGLRRNWIFRIFQKDSRSSEVQHVRRLGTSGVCSLNRYKDYRKLSTTTLKVH